MQVEGTYRRNKYVLRYVLAISIFSSVLIVNSKTQEDIKPVLDNYYLHFYCTGICLYGNIEKFLGIVWQGIDPPIEGCEQHETKLYSLCKRDFSAKTKYTRTRQFKVGTQIVAIVPTPFLLRKSMLVICILTLYVTKMEIMKFFIAFQQLFPSTFFLKSVPSRMVRTSTFL